MGSGHRIGLGLTVSSTGLYPWLLVVLHNIHGEVFLAETGFLATLSNSRNCQAAASEGQRDHYIYGASALDDFATLEWHHYQVPVVGGRSCMVADTAPAMLLLMSFEVATFKVILVLARPTLFLRKVYSPTNSPQALMQPLGVRAL
ncbi:hypothetical protein AC578_1485 [Pseudocercospora eumusae]|uniref:Uncharacterized protein n=1 Tax=Pseudocercospora eumusae TaxID=321146 RepID=A0A139H5P2_9PEZI|nr:hypothetical protein AC578_1485 [Pseudocercospora eumusae]